MGFNLVFKGLIYPLETQNFYFLFFKFNFNVFLPCYDYNTFCTVYVIGKLTEVSHCLWFILLSLNVIAFFGLHAIVCLLGSQDALFVLML